jgi:uncharacterized protein YndB with AHSA1/START domain
MSRIEATQTRTLFRQATAVEVLIDAPAQRIWDLLTDATAQADWNSTLTSFRADIREGGRVQLETTSAPGRPFDLAVTEVDAPRRMVWSDGNAAFRGVRTFTLTETPAGTRFHMEEVLSGAMAPVILRVLPDFVGPFETMAGDLKKTAESAS